MGPDTGPTGASATRGPPPWMLSVPSCPSSAAAAGAGLEEGWGRPPHPQSWQDAWAFPSPQHTHVDRLRAPWVWWPLPGSLLSF